MKQSRDHVHRFVLPALILLLGLAFLWPQPAVATDATAWGGAGGDPFRDECPKGSYLVGLKGRAGEWVDRIAPVCAPWLRGSQTFGAPSVGRFHGASRGGVERQTICWGFGINNRAVQSWDIATLRSSNRLVKYIKAYCTSLGPPASTAKWTFGGPIPDDRTIPDMTGAFGITPPDLSCPAGEVAVGIHGRAGLFVDELGLICGPPPNPSAPATKANPLGKAPVTTDDMFTIVTPGKGDRVLQGNLVVMALPPKVGMTPVTELEFRWLDAPPNQPYVNPVAVETPKLLKGYPVDQAVTRAHSGRWEVRVRASGKTPPGPWSFPVPFQLALSQQTQSQRQAPQPMQQAPLPSSSVTQSPPPMQQAPLPSSAVTQAPSKGSGSSRLFVRPRGVEEKDAEAAPAQPDK